MRISVTTDHLSYLPRSRYIELDLFTRALQRKGLGGVRVILMHGKELPIPEKARELRARWEAGEEIQPFQFEV